MHGGAQAAAVHLCSQAGTPQFWAETRHDTSRTPPALAFATPPRHPRNNSAFTRWQQGGDKFRAFCGLIRTQARYLVNMRHSMVQLGAPDAVVTEINSKLGWLMACTEVGYAPNCQDPGLPRVGGHRVTPRCRAWGRAQRSRQVAAARHDWLRPHDPSLAGFACPARPPSPRLAPVAPMSRPPPRYACCMHCPCHAPQTARQTLRGAPDAARMEGMVPPKDLDTLMRQRDKVRGGPPGGLAVGLSLKPDYC